MGGAQFVSREDLFCQSDVLSLHLVLSECTRGLVGERDFGLMKREAYFINTARAGLVREDALIEALNNKTIAGAGLDVFDQEPLARDHPLRSLDNVVLTPHLGYYTREMIATYYEDAITTIEAYLNGRMINVVN